MLIVGSSESNKIIAADVVALKSYFWQSTLNNSTVNGLNNLAYIN